MNHTAHEIAADPELYNTPVYLGPSSRVAYECMGYSRSGNKVQFARLLTHRASRSITVSRRYLDPDQTVYTNEVPHAD